MSVALPAEQIEIDPLFTVSQLLSIDRESHGSWVALCEDPLHRLVISPQHREGLIRVTLNDAGTKVKTIEHLKHLPGKAQGLLYHNGALYLVRNETTKAHSAGLYRLDDTDADSTPDRVTLLSRFHGAPQSEHGPHALLLDPTGHGLLLVAGNHTDLPAPLTASFSIPEKEDRVGERIWDPRGHAVDKRAPGGWIARYSLAHKNWELIASGFRNAYDMTFNSRGDLFAFDSDMEWDRGTPWYRPTALYHVTIGAEFGWRSGTSKWPWELPDVCPPVIALGEGSPTGVFAGTHAAFPPAYRESVFVMDWSHGAIRRISVTPKGTSYTAEAHPFLRGRPLPLTDGIVRQSDGAIYFITGGRFTQSGLYRVAARKPSPRLAAKERTVHALQMPVSPLNSIWDKLGSADRRTRYTARLALEKLSVDKWRARAHVEKQPTRQLGALCALARVGTSTDASEVLATLLKHPFTSFPENRHVDHLRIAELLLVRHPSMNTLDSRIAEYYAPHFPSGNPAVTRQMARVLAGTHQPRIPALLLHELLNAPSQEEALTYALCLSESSAGMTQKNKLRFFAWLTQAERLEGGKSLVGFIAAIRRRTLEHTPSSERPALEARPAPITTAAQSPPEITRRSGKQWIRNDFLDLGWKPLEKCNFSNGRAMFLETKCALCHEFKGKGVGAGPDLTAAGGRFSAADLLLHILEPSRVISDQYQATNIFCHDGRILAGRIVERSPTHVTLSTAPTDLSIVESVEVSAIDIERPSRISTMPQGLLDGLKRQDILDLLAYIISVGDPDYSAFR